MCDRYKFGQIFSEVRLHQQLEAGMAGIFASDTANEWMKGLLSSAQVIAGMGIQLDRRFRDDFLARRLDLDCARMRVNAKLFEVLRVLRAEAVVVIPHRQHGLLPPLLREGPQPQTAPAR